MRRTIFVLVLLFGVAVGSLFAQGDKGDSPFEIQIYWDQYSLTIVIPGNRLVSLVGFQLEFVEQNGIISKNISEYPRFSVFSPFSNILAPQCFRLVASEQNAAELPLICNDNNTMDQPINLAEVNWYSNGSLEAIVVTSSNGTRTVCQNINNNLETGFCIIQGFIPATFTPTPPATNTPTPSPTPDRQCPDWMAPVPGSENPAFCIDITEVTNAAFEQFINSGAYSQSTSPPWSQAGIVWLEEEITTGSVLPLLPAMNNPDFARVLVSWYEAEAYCNWIGQQNQRLMRLPTEAEWQIAAGTLVMEGANINISPDSDSDLDLTVGNKRLQPLQPNEFGLFDMVGNASEWVIADGGDFITMGGSWATKTEIITEFREDRSVPDPNPLVLIQVGFRCLMPLS